MLVKAILGLAAISVIVLVALFWFATRFGASIPLPTEATSASNGIDELTLEVAADQPLSLVFAGTSLTNRGSWPEALARELSACRTGPISVQRLAKPGANSDWGKDQVLSYLSGNTRKPDLLFVEFSINDASFVRGIPLAKSAANTREIVDAAKNANVPVILLTMSPAFGTSGLVRPGQASYRAIYHQFRQAGETALVDTVPAWFALSEEKRTALMPDALHPTMEGMTEIHIPALAAALKPLVCGRSQ